MADRAIFKFPNEMVKVGGACEQVFEEFSQWAGALRPDASCATGSLK